MPNLDPAEVQREMGEAEKLKETWMKKMKMTNETYEAENDRDIEYYRRYFRGDGADTTEGKMPSGW